VADNTVDKQIDSIFNLIDNLLLQSKFSTVNDILEALDIYDQPIVIVVSYLSICYAAKDKLPYYEHFLRSARNYFTRERGDDEGYELTKGFSN